MKHSAGILLYRQGTQGVEILLVHPSGDYNAQAPWSIPKGEIDEDEDAQTAALRELKEETGVTAGDAEFLGSVIYPTNKKEVSCFFGKGDSQEPKPNSWEVDKAEYVPINKAEEVINKTQREFILRLKGKLV